MREPVGPTSDGDLGPQQCLEKREVDLIPPVGSLRTSAARNTKHRRKRSVWPDIPVRGR